MMFSTKEPSQKGAKHRKYNQHGPMLERVLGAGKSPFPPSASASCTSFPLVCQRTEKKEHEMWKSTLLNFLIGKRLENSAF